MERVTGVRTVCLCYLCLLVAAPGAGWALDVTRPIANGGPDQRALVGQTIELDGSGSTDGDGRPLRYMWTLTVAPDGSVAALSSPSALKPSLTVDRLGDYVINLVVDNGIANSYSDTVVISTSNTAPIAYAGPDKTMALGSTVQLDSAGSADIDGDPLAFAWLLVKKPATSVVDLVDSLGPRPTFFIDAPGDYVARVIAGDGKRLSKPDTVTLSTGNTAPVAKAGPDLLSLVGKTVALNGQSSTDANGDKMTYSWSLLSRPEASSAYITSAYSAVAGLVPDTPGDYVAQLIVHDGTVASAPDTITITAFAEDNQLFLEALKTVPEGTWRRLNLNRFDSVWVPVDLRVIPKGSIGSAIPGSPRRILIAWSSMAWDSNRGDLIFWGGGHANYPGNEVYRWRSATLRWERASLPSDVVFKLGGIVGFHYEPVDGVFNAPVASHTYDNSEFLPVADRFVTFGGAAYGGGPFMNYEVDPAVKTGPYFWDPDKADPNRAGGTTGSHANVLHYPDIVGGRMWENRDRILSGATTPESRYLLSRYDFKNGTSDAVVENGVDVVYFNAKALWKYIVRDPQDASKDQLVQVGKRGDGDIWSRGGAGAYDPVRCIYVRIAGAGFYLWDMRTAGPANVPMRFYPQVLDTGFPVTYQEGAKVGLEYDPVRGRFLLWRGYEDVWILEPPASYPRGNWTLSKASTPHFAREAPTEGPNYGIFGKWKYAPDYDVFLGVNYSPDEGRIWVYKPIGWRPSM